MESVAQSVVTKFGVLLVDELQEISGVGEKVVQLMDELATMNAVLRMLSEADESTVDHLVREWTKQVRELVYDSEDCIDIYWIRIRRPIPLLQWPKYQIQKLLLRRTLAADVRALLGRTTAVNERRARHGIDREELRRSACFAPVSAASVSARALHRGDDPHQFVGIWEQASTLAKAVSTNAYEGDEKLKVFSLVGFGGVGKTAMAMEVCRQLAMVGDFQCQALVSVSQAFDGEKDIKGLLLRILQQINPQNTSETDAETLLKELLNEKRYLIIIDDVWSLQAWEAICIRLPKNNKGSRVIVTTRIESVAKAASGSDDTVHQMKPLVPEASEKLFLKTVFGSMEKNTCPMGLNEIMEKILKKCGGLPLAIVSIGSLLASYNSADSIEVWGRVSSSIGSQMENHPTLEGMRKVISLSYDYLPHHLKACMLYLSIFPEDYVIEKYRLLYRWIAEGLVAEKRGLTLLEIAEDYYNDLASRSMIIKLDKIMVYNYYGYEEVERCQVHDMMLEVMVSKSLETNFVRLVGRQYGEMSNGKVRRLSIHGDCDTVKKLEQRRVRHGIEAMKLEHVRSLTIFQSEVGLSKLLDRLVEFKLLRVLDLQDCRALQNEHMRYVCRLYLLRFLSLRGTRISVMPSKIGDLEHLVCLDIEESDIFQLPQTVTKLTKLERLKSNQWDLPRGIGSMKALREVGMAIIKDNKTALEIGELQQLQVLCIVVAEGCEFIGRDVASSLEKTYSLRELHMSSSGSNDHIAHNAGMDVMQHMSSPPPLLRIIHLDFALKQLPDWIPSLTHLVDLDVRVCQQSNQVLDAFCNLPNLQIVVLHLMQHADRELVARATHIFPMLRSLTLRIWGAYPESIGFEVGSMTKLKTLELELCVDENRSIDIVGIENLRNLKEVKLRGDIYGENVPERVKTENANRTESNQIKVLTDYFGR